MRKNLLITAAALTASLAASGTGAVAASASASASQPNLFLRLGL